LDPDIEVIDVPNSDHFSIMIPPATHLLAAEIEKVLSTELTPWIPSNDSARG
jgi:TorA maturation chaperone TorD